MTEDCYHLCPLNKKHRAARKGKDEKMKDTKEYATLKKKMTAKTIHPFRCHQDHVLST